MANHVETDHIRQLIEAGAVESLPVAVSEAADRHLWACFPLRIATSIIDWDKVSHMVLKWMAASDDETALWASITIAGQCPFGLLLLDREQPCLIGGFDFMIRNLDTLVWKAPGCRILFGVHRDNEGRIEFTTGVVEFDGKDKLFASTE